MLVMSQDELPGLEEEVEVRYLCQTDSARCNIGAMCTSQTWIQIKHLGEFGVIYFWLGSKT